MLPLRDNVPASRFPIVTMALIVANLFAFLHELKLGHNAEYLLMDYGIVPARYTNRGFSQHFTMLESVMALATLLGAYELEAVDEEVPVAAGITLQATGPARVRLRPRTPTP